MNELIGFDTTNMIAHLSCNKDLLLIRQFIVATWRNVTVQREETKLGPWLYCVVFTLYSNEY